MKIGSSFPNPSYSTPHHNYVGLLVFVVILAGENSKEIISAFKLSIKTENFISYENLLALVSITGTLFAFFSILQ